METVVCSLIKKQFCAALFTDTSKAIDTVDRKMLMNKLPSIGLDDVPLSWFHSYLIERTQTVVADGAQ